MRLRVTRTLSGLSHELHFRTGEPDGLPWGEAHHLLVYDRIAEDWTVITRDEDTAVYYDATFSECAWSERWTHWALLPSPSRFAESAG